MWNNLHAGVVTTSTVRVFKNQQEVCLKISLNGRQSTATEHTVLCIQRCKGAFTTPLYAQWTPALTTLSYYPLVGKYFGVGLTRGTINSSVHYWWNQKKSALECEPSAMGVVIMNFPQDYRSFHSGQLLLTRPLRSL